MQETKNHYRIPLKEIHETPANGTYIPDTQLKKLKKMSNTLIFGKNSDFCRWCQKILLPLFISHFVRI